MAKTLPIVFRQTLADKKAVCLVDGEHYPPVTKWTVDELQKEGANIVALVFIGGTEKVENAVEELGGDSTLWNVYVGGKQKEETLQVIRRVLKEAKPELVIDLSDEPVLDYRTRFELASHILAHNVSYMGADFIFTPPSMRTILKKPSLGIIGTGKRVGKTAVGVTVARLLNRKGFQPLVVCMGRGGPPDPDVVDAGEMELTAEVLLEVAEQGGHAASDYWEDALLGQVPTIGCRRCGGGMGGNPFLSNVIEGAEIANELPAQFVIMEGSGATFAPVHTDRKLVTVGAGQPLENILDFLGRYRILISQLAVVTMCEPPMAGSAKVDKIAEGIQRINPQCDVALTVFRPEPLGDLADRKVFVATTAPEKVADNIKDYLEDTYNCTITGFSTNLSNRRVLREDLRDGLKNADVLLTEIKAASIDVAAKAAQDEDVQIIFLHNKPVLTGGTVENLTNAIVDLCAEAQTAYGE
ncbi:MAG: cyclic 2,3-diphosphoglycerate synthetase [Planctomycetes bacterium]|nr:cyclic 2,3-diphosphoglycerate synthetase [Planctomycetota bacterium]